MFLFKEVIVDDIPLDSNYLEYLIEQIDFYKKI